MAAILFAILGALGGQQDQGADTSLLDKIRPYVEMYRANRLAFPFGVFHFEFVKGRAEDADAVRRGEVDRLLTAKGYYAFDGRNGRYELLPETEVLLSFARESSEPGRISMPIPSHRVLTDGDTTLIDYIAPRFDAKSVHHSVQIMPGLERFFTYFRFPLDLGQADPPHDLTADFSACLAGKFHVDQLDPSVLLDGIKVVRFAIASDRGIRTYWIDPDRGGLPIRIEARPLRSATPTFVWILDRIALIDNLGWFPRRMAVYTPGDKGVTEVIVNEMELKRPPDRSAFHLGFDAPVHVVDGVRSAVYEPRRDWSLHALPTLTSRATRKVSISRFTPAPALELPGEREDWPGWTMPTLTLIGLVGFVVALIVLRKRGRARLDT